MNELEKISPIRSVSWNKNKSNQNFKLASNNKSPKNYIQMGNKIKEARLKYNLTQDDLAKQVNCSSGYISSLERGKQGASDEFLVTLEKALKLGQKTLHNLRDKQSTNEFKELEYKSMMDRYPGYIMGLVETLLSCDEEYARQKVMDFMNQLQEDYFNRLTPYELKEVKKKVIAIKRSWVQGNKHDDSQGNAISLQGYIINDDHKHYFSLDLTSYGLQLNLFYNDRQHAQYFEGWLGSCSISYSTNLQLPYLKEKEKMSCYLWFNPHISIAAMYAYLNEQNINIHNMEINEPRLHWFIQEMTV